MFIVVVINAIKYICIKYFISIKPFIRELYRILFNVFDFFR